MVYMLKICPELRIYAIFQILQTLFIISVFGWQVYRKNAHVAGILTILGWCAILYLLCKNDRRRWAWWFVTVSIVAGIFVDILILASPMAREIIKKSNR